MKRAKVALARKLATILHRMWMDESEFRWDKETSCITGGNHRSASPNACSLDERLEKRVLSFNRNEYSLASAVEPCSDIQEDSTSV